MIQRPRRLRILLLGKEMAAKEALCPTERLPRCSKRARKSFVPARFRVPNRTPVSSTANCGSVSLALPSESTTCASALRPASRSRTTENARSRCSVACQHISASSCVSRRSNMASADSTTPSDTRRGACSRSSSYLLGIGSACSRRKRSVGVESAVEIWSMSTCIWRVERLTVRVRCVSRRERRRSAMVYTEQFSGWQREARLPELGASSESAREFIPQSSAAQSLDCGDDRTSRTRARAGRRVRAHSAKVYSRSSSGTSGNATGSPSGCAWTFHARIRHHCAERAW